MSGLAYALHDLVLTMDRHAERLLAPLGLTYRRYLCLAIIGEHPGISAAQLTGPMQTSQAALSQLLKVLVGAGWVSAELIAGRGHRRFLRLTPIGEQLLSQASQRLGTSFDDVVRRTGNDPAALLGIIASIHSQLRNPKE